MDRSLLKKTSYLLLFLIFSCIGEALHAQSTKAWLKIDSQGYEVEVSQENGVYRILLTNTTNKNSHSEKTNYLTTVTFERAIFDLHKLLEAERLKKPVAEIQISTETEKGSKGSIQLAFLQIITSLYNTETRGQKIGEITLRSSVSIDAISFSSTQSAKGTKAAMRQRGGKKWKNKIEKRKKKRVRKSIKKLTKKEIMEGLTDAETKKLCQLEEALKSLDSPSTGTGNGKRPELEKLTIETARVVFEDGSIKEVTIKGINSKGNDEIYSNKFSIGASTRKNVQDFDRISLFQETHQGKKSRSKKITLSNAIDYERILGRRTNDYSPADVKIQLEPGKMQELFKAPSSKLFTLNVFSDLSGFDQNNPNGLVQLEFNRRINLWTRRTDAWLFKSMGFGMFTHMTPIFELTKIEENNRNIEFSGGGQTGEPQHLSLLQLQRFSYARLINELNLFDLQGASLSIHTNIFGGINVTRIQDTLGTGLDQKIFDENINSLMLGVNVKAMFNPEWKWAFQLSSRWTYFDALNSIFTFRSHEGGVLSGPNYLLNTWEFLLTWDTGAIESTSQNKLFARFRFNHEWGYWNNNYSEFQIGYSIFLKSSQVATKKK